MEYTKNYKLPQWVETDRIQMEDFNQAMADIDAGLAAVKSGTAESQAQLGEEIAAIATAMGNGGKNCRIAWGSYVGTGTYGASNKVTLTFDFRPMLIFVASPKCDYNSAVWPAPLFRGVNVSRACFGSYAATDGVLVSWGENSVSYHSNYQPGEQNNLAGTTYYFIAFGYTP